MPGTPHDTARRQGILVSHTHWDRAWYLPFQSMRVRLIRFVDALLDLLECHPDFRSFTLDGQAVVLEDYLALRPQNAVRLERLARAGRLSLGPWYTLPDLFLAGGEAVIRNLQMGHEICRRFGEPLKVGYVPDSFGHFAQLPQILRGFDMHSFVFMRGMDRELLNDAGPVFEWCAPDGSSVTAVCPPGGYLGASALGHAVEWGRFDGHKPEAPLALARLKAALAADDQRGSPVRALLLMNGCDHMPAQPELPGLLKEIRGPALTELDLSLEHGTLEEFFARLTQEAPTLATYTGDLLGAAEHPILSSVYSTRTRLKELNHEAQHRLTHVAEPLLATLESSGQNERALLDEAWKLLLKNHAHDDICGCSTDEVHEQNAVLFKEARQIAETLATEALERAQARGFAPLASSARGVDLFVFNPLPFERRVSLETDVFFVNPEGEFANALAATSLQARDAAGGPLPLRQLETCTPAVRSRFLETSWGRRDRVRLEVTLPALGYELVRIEEGAGPALVADSAQAELLKWAQHALRYEYELDGGDTYSFSPVPGAKVFLAVLKTAAFSAQDPTCLELHHEIEVPASIERANPHCDGPARTQPSPHTVTLSLTTHLRVLPGAAGIEADCRYENLAQNGRLRAHIVSDIQSDHLQVHSAFRLAEHKVSPARDYSPQKPAYPGERPYPTACLEDFALAGDAAAQFWVAARGLREIEALAGRDQKLECALTLHRSVGELSVNGGGIRACQAGPAIATPGAQERGAHRHFFAFGKLIGPEAAARALRAAQGFAHPAHVESLPHLPHLQPDALPRPRRASFVSVDSPRVTLTSFRHGAAVGERALRLGNLSASYEKLRLRFDLGVTHACFTNLSEVWNESTASALAKDATLELELKPFEIRTVLVR